MPRKKENCRFAILRKSCWSLTGLNKTIPLPDECKKKGSGYDQTGLLLTSTRESHWSGHGIKPVNTHRHQHVRGGVYHHYLQNSVHMLLFIYYIETF